MVANIEQELAFALGKTPPRKGGRRAVRYVSGLDKAGRARTSTFFGDALTWPSAAAAGRFARKHGLERRGYRVLEL